MGGAEAAPERRPDVRDFLGAVRASFAMRGGGAGIEGCVRRAYACLDAGVGRTDLGGARLPEGHANAMVVGPGGLESRTDAWVGVSLLAPHVRYPDHRHDPEEAYLLLSPGEFRRGDEDWFEPGAGGTFYNEPGILHAMRSGDLPLLAVWCLHQDLRR